MSEDRLRARMEANRLDWDDRTAVQLHNRTGFHAIDRIKTGDDALRGCVDAEIGEVASKRLIHPQFHFGLGTIRLTRRGAITAARTLPAELDVLVRFVEGNVYDAATLLDVQYDIAFVTWGTIIWLPDIHRWAQIVAELLAPEGWLYLAEGHPLTLSFDEIDGRLAAVRPWRMPMTAPFVYDDAITYTGDPTPLAHTRS